MPMYQFVSNDHDGPVETVVDLPDDAEALDQAKYALAEMVEEILSGRSARPE